MDLDDFKLINDRFGHLTGDAVLRDVAATLREGIREIDTAARYGGEEFAIILPEIDNYNAVQFAEKIRGIVEKAVFRFEDTDIPVTISIGCASMQPDLQEPHEFIRIADGHLYEAKSQGRNRVNG